MYKQFAVTIAISVAISGLVALTFSPAMCLMLLKEGHHGPKKGFFGLFNRGFDKMTDGYTWGVGLKDNGKGHRWRLPIRCPRLLPTNTCRQTLRNQCHLTAHFTARVGVGVQVHVNATGA